MIVSRGSGAWRAGAAVVATLTFDVDAETPILAQGARYARHLTTMSHQAFGPDVAVPRILDLLDQLDVPATFFVPGWVAERRPSLVPSIADRGHEVAHHSYSHRPATALSPQEQRDDFERALEVFDRQGVEIAGHRAALWQTTATTLELLAEHRLAYDSSMMGDDRPYLLSQGGSSVVELPGPLVAGRLGAVCLPSRATRRQRHRGAVEGLRHVEQRARRDAGARVSLQSVPPPVPHWPIEPPRGRTTPGRTCPRARRRVVRALPRCRRPGCGGWWRA